MRHQDLTINHRLESWVFANATARLVPGDYTAGDIGRIGYQSDTGEYWRLTSPTPDWTLVLPSAAFVQAVYGTYANAAITPGVMAGLGGIIRPVRSGKIFVSASGWLTNSAAGGGVQASLRVGVLPQPTQGAASTGSPVGAITQRINGWAADERAPFALTGITGILPIGTDHWLDLVFFTSGTATGTATIAAAFSAYDSHDLTCSSRHLSDFTQLLVLFASVTNYDFINTANGAPRAPFGMTNGDAFLGDLYVIDQAGGPTVYNFWTPVVTGSALALTDGASVHYADAAALTLVTTPYPKLTFTLTVAGAALTTALNATSSNYINIFLEFKCVLAGSGPQKSVLVNREQRVYKTALFPP